MNQHIHCSVNNCHYWKNGNMCDANEIIVVSDDFGRQNPDTIDAPKAASVSATPVGQCFDTCCKTFVQQNSDKINVDGVKRM